jgi:photosystem II stability/assembly factor-like uncharacterized protein
MRSFGHGMMACMRFTVIIAVLLIPLAARAQWTLRESHSTASLRGVHSVGSGVAWASGAGGTVLRTIDGGKTWQTCTVPPKAEKLDFRAVQAFDADTAIVMSAGTGDASRLYKTKDGCGTWTLVFSNPDPTGFWDALQFSSPDFGVLIGDPVRGYFPIFIGSDRGESWQPLAHNMFVAEDRQSLFAASNTSLLVDGKNERLYVGTGGGVTAVLSAAIHSSDMLVATRLDLASGAAAGVFSIASRIDGANRIFVAVGGDYKLPDRTAGTAAFRAADGTWQVAQTPPHGYRSAVAWNPAQKAWIAVGPNGTDISMDDGRTWRMVPDSERNWNAVSLPFVVGSKGRIGKWND